ncbi:MAG: alpha/beta hydrolase [Deltaproteobacteria bacterium]|nr:alpha/beta hydrolase [Deltaproteobacteria bacterium]
MVWRDPLVALDRLAPAEGYEVHHDLAYGDADFQRLDVYVPDREADGERAAVVFFHGGRWSFGAKHEYRYVAQALAAAGFVAVVCDYRKYPQVRFPAFVEDGAAATAWALANLEGYGVDPRKIFVMGHSSGAHIGALLAMDERYLACHGTDGSAIAGLVLMSGPFDFLPIRGRELRDIFGPEEQHASSQPLRFARADAPPMLLLHGRRDRTVYPANSARLASAIRERGGRARTRFYPQLSHTNILGALSASVGFLFGPVLEDVLSFLRGRCEELGRDPGQQPEAAL